MMAVEAFCDATGDPATRFDDRVLGAADLLLRLRAAIIMRWADCWSVRFPLLHRRCRYRTPARWSRGGPPEELLGPPDVPIPTTEHDANEQDANEQDAQMGASRCQHCGQPMTRGGRGRPAKHCSGTCRGRG